MGGWRRSWGGNNAAFNITSVDQISSDPQFNLVKVLNSTSMYNPEFVCNYAELASLCNLPMLSTFSIFSLNVRSLPGKFDELLLYLKQSHPFEFTVLAFQEVWSVSTDLRIDSYQQLEFNTRDKNEVKRNPNCGGGVGMYIREGFSYEVLEFENEFTEGVYESQWLKVFLPDKSSRIIGNIYRPNTAPRGNLPQAMKIHSSIISKIKRQHKKSSIQILSDFNVNLLNYKTHPQTAEYVDDHFCQGLLPMITKPTRIYHRSASLIDHIFTTPTENPVSVGVLTCAVSDHLATFISEEMDWQPPNLEVTEYRRINEKNTVKFKGLLSNTDWGGLEGRDPQIYYDEIFSKLDCAFNEAFPNVKSRPKLKKDPPWFSKSLAVSSRHKSKLYRKYLKQPSLANKARFRTYSNKFNHLIANAKKSYYFNQIDSYKGNVKKVWEIVRSAMAINKKAQFRFPDYFLIEKPGACAENSPQPACINAHRLGNQFSEVPHTLNTAHHTHTRTCSTLSHTSIIAEKAQTATRPPPKPPDKPVDKIKVSNRAHIAQGFNEFYSQIGPSLSAQIKAKTDVNPPQFGPLHFLTKCESNFTLEPVSCETLLQIIRKLKDKRSAGVDGISNHLLKNSAEYMIKPLHNIINMSIVTGTVPQQLKIANVIPLYKGADAGSKFLYTNYRPIAILNSISKVLEKVVEKQLRSYLDFYDMLSPSQYGFRSKRSTAHAMLDLINFAHDSIDSGSKAISIFVDLAKAFDTLDFEILLQKLNMYGVGGSTLSWFRSYLTGRQQQVQLPCGTVSGKCDVTTGVPQGSVLGPLLFIIYINDLPKCIPLLKTILFADDTSCLYRARNDSELFSTLNNQLERLADFFAANKLSLNVRKTRSMAFLPKNCHFHYHDLVLDNENITWIKPNSPNSETFYKFLGVLLDPELTFKEHINRVLTKLSSATYAVSNSQKVLPRKVVLGVYRALFESHMLYCCAVWGSARPKLLQPLHVLQTKVLKNIFCLPRASHVSPLLYEHKLLRLHDLIKKEHVSIILQMRTGRLPPALKNFASPLDPAEAQHRVARNSEYDFTQPTLSHPDLYHHPKPKIIAAYNSLPFLLKAAPLEFFISQLKSHILSSYNRLCDKVHCSACIEQ